MQNIQTPNPQPRKRSPFTGILGFVILIFIVAWIFFRNKEVAPAVSPASMDSTHTGRIPPDSLHH